MLKLITESPNTDLQIDNKQDGKTYIYGVFAKAEVQNQNGRRYSKPMLEAQVQKYIDTKIATKSAYGAIDHPTKPEVTLVDAAIKIEELEWQDNDLYGKALLLSSPRRPAC